MIQLQTFLTNKNVTKTPLMYVYVYMFINFTHNIFQSSSYINLLEPSGYFTYYQV